MPKVREATLDDLMKEPGKAELVNGEIVRMPPTGFLPGFAAMRILFSLYEYALSHRKGYAVGDNVGFAVDLPKRKSFSPDAAYYVGPHSGMKFLEGAPVFAVEVRSDADYGKKAEKEIAQKRADYFAAGTLVVWDVDMLGVDVVRVYRASNPQTPTIYRRGDLAEAEPAVPGWKMAVEDLFPYHVQ
jgi:Uma2 family endonuclease